VGDEILQFSVALYGQWITAFNEDKFMTITVHDKDREDGGWGTMSIGLKNGWQGEEQSKKPDDKVLWIHSEKTFLEFFDGLMNIVGCEMK